MNRARLRPGTFVSAILSLVAFTLIAVSAQARPKDAVAAKLDEAAMNDDFLAVNFDRAADKLRRAIKECGARGCEEKLRAQLHIHLGIILVNAGKRVLAINAFTDGLKANPAAVVDSDFTTPDIESAFAAAAGKVAPKRQTKDDKAPVSSGNMKHDPVTEAHVNVPIPIFVGEVPSAAKYLLIYQPPGGGGWTKLRMKRMGKTWGAQIPCKDTDDTGTLSYYVVAEDADGDPIANAGSKKLPLSLEIKEKLSGEAPAFPGQEPPRACKEGGGEATCPPGSDDPGCETALAEGSKCTGHGQCNKAEGLACIEGTCQPGEETEAETDLSSKNWLSIGLSLDTALISQNGLCSPDHSNGAYTCIRTDGLFYKPAGATDTGSSGGIPFVPATIRVLVGYDHIVVGNLAVGVRVGYAFNGGPNLPGSKGLTGFFPWHLEPRFTYWIGDDVLLRTGLRPFVFAGGGIAEVDAKLGNVQVSNDCDLQGICRSSRTPQTVAFNTDASPKTHPDGSFVYVTPHGVDVSTLPAKKASKTNVDVYRRMGTTFAGLGGGVMYAFARNAGVTFDLKLAYFFGSPGISLSPTLGAVYGF